MKYDHKAEPRRGDMVRVGMALCRHCGRPIGGVDSVDRASHYRHLPVTAPSRREVPTMTLTFLGDEIVQTHAALIEAIGEMKGYAARLTARGALYELQDLTQRNIEALIVLRDRMEAKL